MSFIPKTLSDFKEESIRSAFNFRKITLNMVVKDVWETETSPSGICPTGFPQSFPQGSSKRQQDRSTVGQGTRDLGTCYCRVSSLENMAKNLSLTVPFQSHGIIHPVSEGHPHCPSYPTQAFGALCPASSAACLAHACLGEDFLVQISSLCSLHYNPSIFLMNIPPLSSNSLA